MALFEALGELVASAILSAAPACEVTIPSQVAAAPGALIPWLQARNEAGSLNAIVEKLIAAGRPATPTASR